MTLLTLLLVFRLNWMKRLGLFQYSREDQFANGNNVYPELPYRQVALSCLSSHTASFSSAVPSAVQQSACLLYNDVVQFAAYRDLLTVNGGQSFSGDLLQYHLFMECLNFSVLRIFSKSDPGVALEIVMKSRSGDALAAICGCAAVHDKAIDLKQVLDVLSCLFGGQRRAIGGHVDRVCEGWPVHDDVKELCSFLIDMMTCQQAGPQWENFPEGTKVNTGPPNLIETPKPYWGSYC